MRGWLKPWATGKARKIEVLQQILLPIPVRGDRGEEGRTGIVGNLKRLIVIRRVVTNPSTSRLTAKGLGSGAAMDTAGSRRRAAKVKVPGR